MFFWWLVVGILVASIVLLTLLLAPLPTFLVSAAVQLLNYIQRPLWLVLVLISWVLVGTPPRAISILHACKFTKSFTIN
jgi:hypothetical protein